MPDSDLHTCGGEAHLHPGSTIANPPRPGTRRGGRGSVTGCVPRMEPERPLWPLLSPEGGHLPRGGSAGAIAGRLLTTGPQRSGQQAPPRASAQVTIQRRSHVTESMNSTEVRLWLRRWTASSNAPRDGIFADASALMKNDSPFNSA